MRKSDGCVIGINATATVNFPYGKKKYSAASTFLNHQTELDMMGKEEAEMLPVIAKAHKLMLLLYKENQPLCFMNEHIYSMFSKKKDPNIKTPPATDPAFHEHINGENLQTMLINPPCGQLEGFRSTFRGRWSVKTITWH